MIEEKINDMWKEYYRKLPNTRDEEGEGKEENDKKRMNNKHGRRPIAEPTYEEFKVLSNTRSEVKFHKKLYRLINRNMETRKDAKRIAERYNNIAMATKERRTSTMEQLLQGSYVAECSPYN